MSPIGIPQPSPYRVECEKCLRQSNMPLHGQITLQPPLDEDFDDLQTFDRTEHFLSFVTCCAFCAGRQQHWKQKHVSLIRYPSICFSQAWWPFSHSCEMYWCAATPLRQ